MFCPHCGRQVSDAQPFCHHCGGKIAPAPEAGAVRSGTAWEDRAERGFFGGLLSTLRESLLRPTEFFKSMKVTGGLTDPLLYAMIVTMFGFLVSYVWQLLLRDVVHGFLPHDLRGSEGFDPYSGLGLSIFSLVMPFLIIAVLFLWSGVLHVLLLLVKGAKNGFEATFRAVSYSYGANLFLVLPFCGGLFASLWGMVMVIIGLKEAHGTSGGKASFAVLFPLILCCVLALLITLLIFGTIAASLGSLSSETWK